MTKLSNLLSYQQLLRKVPVLEWLPNYQLTYILPDIIAGLTVAMTVIPQGIADAALAGLPTEYGLYAGFMGCFVYFFFGSVKDLTIGPTAILSLLTYTVVQNLNADLAVLSTFLSGCMIFLFGVLNLGFLMQFISTPTIVGFMNGATVTIAVGQIRRLLGIRSGKSSEFVDSLDTLYHYYDETTFADATLGISSLILLVVVRHIGRKYPKSIFLRYLSISRNAIIVFGGILIAYLYHLKDEKPFLLTGTISSGFPSIKLPPFSTVHDETDYDFSGMIKALGLSLLTIPIISIVESVAIAKSFNKGKVVDVTQEMLALGLCNIASSFFSSIPITGSFTRSAVNHASGVKTQMGGIFTGIAVLAVLGFLTKTFYFIPKTCLAAVIIAAMFTMMEVRKVFQIYKTRKLDIVPFLGTFLVSLWKGLELGILVGVGINIMFVLYESSRPKLNLINKKIDETEIIYVSPSRNIVYSSAEYFKTKIFEASLREEKIHHIVVDGERIDALDSTSVMNIASMVEDLKFINKSVIFWNWQTKAKAMITRYDPTLANCFQNSNKLEELFQKSEINGNEMSTIVNISRL